MTIRSRCTIALAMLVSLAVAAPAAGAATERIVGGEKVSEAAYASTYRSVVSVQRRIGTRYAGQPIARVSDSLTHACTGTLIAPRLVLTAAHCVSGNGIGGGASGYEVLAGARTLGVRRTTSGRVRVDDVFLHPEAPQTGFGFVYVSFGGSFGGWGGNAIAEHDVAVLRLASPITDIAPTPIVADGEDAAWGDGLGRATGATAAGFGGNGARYSRLASRPTPMHAVAMPIRSDRRCERTDEGLGIDAQRFDRTTMLCAGVADGASAGNTAKATCHGDGGGPLLAPTTDGSMRVVGVATISMYGGTCTGWSVFGRVAGLRDWIASIPADSGGPNGLAAPTGVTGSPVGLDGVRVRWTASAGASRYFVAREVSSTIARRYLGAAGDEPAFAVVAATGPVDTTIVVRGVAPRRPGQSATRLVRVDAQDEVGNRVEGEPVAVTAPVDGRAPSTPSRPVLVEGRRRSGPSLRFRGAFDADCVQQYLVQLRGETGGWRTTSTNTRVDCELDGLGLRRTSSPTRIPTLTQRIGRVAAGGYRARIVAVDRAGNRSVSRAIRVTLDVDRSSGGRIVNVIVR